MEINIADDKVKENQLLENDVNFGKYVEYVTNKVDVDCIKAIIVPKLFKDKIDLPEDIMSKITWCELKANYYGEKGKENCLDDVLEQFAKTAEIMDASEFNFFRGKNEDRTIIDLYDVQYIW